MTWSVVTQACLQYLMTKCSVVTWSVATQVCVQYLLTKRSVVTWSVATQVCVQYLMTKCSVMTWSVATQVCVQYLMTKCSVATWSVATLSDNKNAPLWHDLLPPRYVYNIWWQNAQLWHDLLPLWVCVKHWSKNHLGWSVATQAVIIRLLTAILSHLYIHVTSRLPHKHQPGCHYQISHFGDHLLLLKHV